MTMPNQSLGGTSPTLGGTPLGDSLGMVTATNTSLSLGGSDVAVAERRRSIGHGFSDKRSAMLILAYISSKK